MDWVVKSNSLLLFVFIFYCINVIEKIEKHFTVPESFILFYNMTLKGSAVSPELQLGSVTLDQILVKDKKLAATGLARISVKN